MSALETLFWLALVIGGWAGVFAVLGWVAELLEKRGW